MHFIVSITQRKYVTNLSKMKEINHSRIVFCIHKLTVAAVFIDFNQILLFNWLWFFVYMIEIQFYKRSIVLVFRNFMEEEFEFIFFTF